MPVAKSMLGPTRLARTARLPHRGLPTMSKMRISRSARTFLSAAFGTRVAPVASAPLLTGTTLSTVLAPCPACMPACVRSSRAHAPWDLFLPQPSLRRPFITAPLLPLPSVVHI